MTLVATGVVTRDVLQPARGFTDEEWTGAERSLAERGILTDTGRLTELGYELAQRGRGGDGSRCRCTVGSARRRGLRGAVGPPRTARRGDRRRRDRPFEQPDGAAEALRSVASSAALWDLHNGPMVVLLAVGAALVNAVTSFLQRLGIESAPRESAMSKGLVAHALRSPVWVLGFVCMGGAFVLQALALHGGSLVLLVQPLLTTELLSLVLIWWAVRGARARPGLAVRRAHGRRARHLPRRGGADELGPHPDARQPGSSP